MDSLQFTIVNFQETYAILENPQYPQIYWPIKKLPDDIKIGSQVTLSVGTPTIDYKKLIQELIS